MAVTILVCHHKPQFVQEVVSTAHELSPHIRAIGVTNLEDLRRVVRREKLLFALFLGCNLKDGRSTLEFLKELKKGKYPHLVETDLYFISNYDPFLVQKDKLLKSVVPGVALSQRDLGIMARKQRMTTQAAFEQTRKKVMETVQRFATALSSYRA